MHEFEHLRKSTLKWLSMLDTSHTTGAVGPMWYLTAVLSTTEASTYKNRAGAGKPREAV